MTREEADAIVGLQLGIYKIEGVTEDRYKVFHFLVSYDTPAGGGPAVTGMHETQVVALMQKEWSK